MHHLKRKRALYKFRNNCVNNDVTTNTWKKNNKKLLLLLYSGFPKLFASRTLFCESAFFTDPDYMGHKLLSNIAGISRLSSVTMSQPDQVVLSTNLFFKIDVSLPSVTRELLQNTVDVTHLDVTHVDDTHVTHLPYSEEAPG